MDETITIQQVQEFSQEIAERVRELAKKIGSNYKELTDTAFTDLISSPVTHLYVAKDQNNTILGMVTLVVYRIPYVKKASMEDLVVDEVYRGKGIGTMLIQKVLSEAESLGAAYLDFTSRPRREGENSFYQKLGFTQRETNVYRHIFDYQEV